MKKTVLITGCSPGGIGNALAREFYSKGLHVIATARNPSVLKDLKDLGMSTLTLDVTNHESIETCKQEVLTITGGSLNILVNNAGRTYPMPLIDASITETRAVIETNVLGPLSMTQSFIPLLMAAANSSPSSDALIINISSTSDRAPFPFKGIYAMSKAALSAFSRTLSVELHHLDVRVLTVVTGFVSSNLGRGAQDPPQPALPGGSLYTSMADVLVRKGRGRMGAEEYARGVVAEALRGRGWELGPFCFGGRREWLWLGAQSGRVWTMGVLGEKFAKWVVMRVWGFWRLKKAVMGKKD